MTSAITKELNNWLEKNEFKVRVRGDADDFCWYGCSNTIEYSVRAADKHLRLWSQLLDSLGLNAIIDPFYSAFLHEVGHSITYWDFTEEEIEEYYETLESMDEEPDSFVEDITWTYFHLPMEIVATEWMVNYINSHFEAVKELVDAVRPLLVNYLTSRKDFLGKAS